MSNPKSPKTKYKEIRDKINKERLAYDVLRHLLLKPLDHLFTIPFYCSVHPITYQDKPNAKFEYDSNTWSCDECKRRGYRVGGDILQLVKFTYRKSNIKTLEQAYNKLVFIIDRIEQDRIKDPSKVVKISNEKIVQKTP